MSHDAITPPPAPAFRRHGDLLLLSGQVGVDELWRPATGAFPDEVRAAFANVRRVLAEAGALPDQILKVTAYLADLGDFDVYNDVWTEEFPGRRPARTTIGARLVPPFRVELDVVAWLDGTR
ncbi:2-iminobutanoate/2-iminopropanoate deaminase [Amycolatopsis xylanica]|uniref:2-iminobutanoate/2-iminopropanoate deaminase n=1 Tax=Amycolatopsis xylanica TaxID=589385 RepID=A0A1H2WGS8_9PSEU|nr:RidA family protein [Amycolatopsis xylanica]SDW79718.1 2-iminobutanoate/2-iminopropanoate deaminase [Amycolatopsis xylanica]